jgi:hypothetical protein
VIFAASWAISAHLYSLLQRFAPSNIVIHRVHTRAGIKWGPLVGLAGTVVYGLVMVVTATIVHHGGPGWVNLLVLVAFWNALRFAVLIPVSVVRLLRVRHQETIVIRDWQRSQLADLPQTAPDLSDAPAPLAHRS